MTAPTKTSIDPSEIRAGDLIRWEPGAGVLSNYRAVEYKAGCDGQQQQSNGAYFLLDRPSPPVTLPTEPTLGWLTRYLGEESSGLGRTGTQLGWFHSEVDSERVFEVDSLGAHVDSYADVTAFTPATAVPTDALDELRAAQEKATYSDGNDSHRNYQRKDAINAFLAAAIEATS